ncbi:4Fe-4S dicluster domain-containing protein [Eggerthellaceae bacterium zg-887]|uniref:4Fe-4S dicluster domain-containing protein n=1 Tax=Xiamenia xianingshaonis TaxID=2682776 RepID=UPI0014099BE4|nr:4Fe-4S dicluster domain-containing protein [Xiamenia xianingshaonis]NHM16076.1 4Fe-4S dicluster domain-containing protein [Xiamenia xianingshaonis]
MSRYGFVIDTKRCSGCGTCMVACKSANHLPTGVWWNRMLTDGGGASDAPAGEYPQLRREYITLACQHCENPACVKVCPVGATYKDEGTGVVRQDYDKCIGCRMCMSACPYTGVRSFNWEEPKYPFELASGDVDSPAHQKHTVEKCTACWHRLAKGEDPACVVGCPAEARFSGDLDDSESQVSKLIASRKYKQLLPEEGTNPSVYYLV